MYSTLQLTLKIQLTVFATVPFKTSNIIILMISGLFLQLSFHKLTEYTGEGAL